MKTKTKSLKKSIKAPTELPESELSRVSGGLNTPIFDLPSPTSALKVDAPQGFCDYDGNIMR
jgi:hypothetical protein